MFTGLVQTNQFRHTLPSAFQKQHKQNYQQYSNTHIRLQTQHCFGKIQLKGETDLLKNEIHELKINSTFGLQRFV